MVEVACRTTGHDELEENDGLTTAYFSVAAPST